MLQRTREFIPQDFVGYAKNWDVVDTRFVQADTTTRWRSSEVGKEGLKLSRLYVY
jgi:hypothetical protein